MTSAYKLSRLSVLGSPMPRTGPKPHPEESGNPADQPHLSLIKLRLRFPEDTRNHQDTYQSNASPLALQGNTGIIVMSKFSLIFSRTSSTLCPFRSLTTRLYARMVSWSWKNNGKKIVKRFFPCIIRILLASLQPHFHSRSSSVMSVCNIKCRNFLHLSLDLADRLSSSITHTWCVISSSSVKS